MREDIKNRIVKIQKGDIPNNYQKYHFGIIPSDWKLLKLKNVARKQNEKNSKSEVNFVLTNSATKGIISQEDYFDKKIANEENYDSYYIVKEGYFVYNPRISTSAPCGPINIYEGKKVGIMSPLYTVFSLEGKNIDNTFLKYYFKSSLWYGYMNTVANFGARSDRMNITSEDLFNMPIPCPSEKEQKKISALLDCYEKKINLVSEIILEKKRRLIYMTNSLILGKIRINNYNDQWEEVKLRTVINEKMERNSDCEIDRVLSVNNKLGFISQEDQFGKNVASENVASYKIIKNGYIAYNPSRINVGSIALYDGEKEGIVSPMYVVFNTSKKLLGEYLLRYTTTQHFIRQMKVLLCGSVRETLNYNDLCKVHVFLPSIEEQKAIIKRVSIFEHEVALLEKKLEQIKLEKKTMMQLLLSGVVRVN